MIIFARHNLVSHRRPPPDEPALVLEGDWPDEDCVDARQALDRAIDARHGWIDEAAVELSERACHCERSLAWINALALRYYLVRLLRPIAFFQDTPAGRSVSHVVLHAARPRDADSTEVIGQLCRQRGLRLDVHWHNGAPRALPPAPVNGAIRRMASWLNSRLPLGSDRSDRPRVLLCGNPAHLSPVCRELMARGCSVAWLYDRFAFGAAVRWTLRGVRQFTCDSSRARDSAFEVDLSEPLVCRGVDLSQPILNWLRTVHAHKGAAQTRLVQQVDQHIAAWRPAAVVLDEDATPMARIAVAVAREHGVRSLVVQHGVPRVRFGFAPLAADGFLAWGASSAAQLAEWGVPRERIIVTGSPRMPAPLRRSRPAIRPTVLLLATTPPADSRPDAVEYHLTTRTYAQMLRMALAAAAGVPEARLIVKLHPRCRDASLFHQLAAEFPTLACRIVRDGSVEHLCREADVALNCASSAGLEAAHLGLPVIELLPEGARELAAANGWGLLGWATSFDELCALLDQALTARQPLHERRSAFADHGPSAARAVVDAVLNADAASLVLQEAR